MRRLRFVVLPSWLALHALTVALVVTMVILGRWQLTVSEDKGFSVQNFGYALQWWAFSVFVVIMWCRALRDAYRKHNAPTAATGTSEQAEPSEARVAEASPVAIERPEPVVYRRYVVPTTMQPVDDPLHTAYNDYLAQLAAADASTEELR